MTMIVTISSVDWEMMSLGLLENSQLHTENSSLLRLLSMPISFVHVIYAISGGKTRASEQLCIMVGKWRKD